MTRGHMLQKPPHQVSLRLVIIIAAIVFAVVAAAAVFFATQFFAYQPGGDDEVQRVVSKVEKLYVLPQGELKVVKIQDKDKLGSQVFYEQAQNGDYVLVYPQAKLALLYRESVNKLVNVAPISLGDAQNAVPPTNSGAAETP